MESVGSWAGVRAGGRNRKEISNAVRIPARQSKTCPRVGDAGSVKTIRNIFILCGADRRSLLKCE